MEPTREERLAYRNEQVLKLLAPKPKRKPKPKKAVQKKKAAKAKK